MGKKFGSNSKADEARARQESAKRETNAKKQKEKEDKAW